MLMRRKLKHLLDNVIFTGFAEFRPRSYGRSSQFSEIWG